ncbi:MAG TPA: DUF4258 domain-containing protein [Aquificales bacterium]|nr:DUF4258 domain-containing protein [Aquificales bacterium]
MKEDLPIKYTKHFWEQFEERGKHSPVPITIELVEETIKNPDLVLDDPNHPKRKWLIKKVAERCFKVIVETKGTEIIAITLMFDRGLRRKGLCK